MHVHAAGCRDAVRLAKKAGPGSTWTISASSMVDVAGHVYDGQIGDRMAETGRTFDETAVDYLCEFHFAPCVHLPETNAEEPADETDAETAEGTDADIAVELPEAVAEYASKLLCTAKKDHLVALTAALLTGGEEPEVPAQHWGPKLDRKVRRLVAA